MYQILTNFRGYCYLFNLGFLQVFAPSEKIENINDQYWTLPAEEVPEEEKSLGPFDRLIHVYHFTKDTQNQTVMMEI